MPAPTVVILAAGEGTRMRSATPKVLHPLCGRPLIAWPIDAARDAGAGKVVVVDGPKRHLDGHLPEDVEIAIQPEANGTGGALAAAADHVGEETVVVLMGDVPLITAGVIAELVAAHEESGAAGTVISAELADPSGYGRLVRGADGSVERIVETKAEGDATEAELAIREVSTGIFAFSGAPLREALDALSPDNAQGELYLPDTFLALRDAGHAVAGHAVADTDLLHGINDRASLAAVRAIAQRRIAREHMLAGVAIVDPAQTVIDAGVRIGRDTIIEPGSALKGDTVVGDNAVVGPHTTLIDTVVGDGASVIHSYCTGATIDAGATAGPFAYLRPGAHLHEKAKAGTFVEIKNSEIGPGAKVPHLSYVGDADVGEGANLGAGTITANYDGFDKHRTTIGKGARIGVDTALVAPVEIGEGAYTAAGSPITEDVPPGALGVARGRQANVEDYAKRAEERKKP